MERARAIQQLETLRASIERAREAIRKRPAGASGLVAKAMTVGNLGRDIEALGVALEALRGQQDRDDKARAHEG